MSTFNYPDFSGGPSINLEGTAVVTGSSLVRLINSNTSDVGAVWKEHKVDRLGAFTCDYVFQLTTGTHDGACFVIHNDPRNLSALGAAGNNAGYSGGPGTEIINSVAFVFGFQEQQIRVQHNDGLGAGAITDFTLPYTPVNILNHNQIAVHLVYDGSTITWSVTDQSTLDSASGVSPAINIISHTLADTAYVGHTAGCGFALGTAFVRSWSWNSGGDFVSWIGDE